MSHLLGKPIPKIEAVALQGELTLNPFSLEQYRGELLVVFFYPWDFSFICPTELYAFQDFLPWFDEQKVKLVACSTNDRHCLGALLKIPKEDGGFGNITFPIIADESKEVSRAFGVLKEDEGIAYRGLFFVDEEGIVRHETFNDIPIDRSPQEVLRVINSWKAYQNTWGEGKSSSLPCK